MKVMKMKRKLLAILVSLAMAFTMMPIMGAPAYADDPALAAPGIAIGPDVLSVGSNTSGAATVHMADKAWRVIGYDGSGVARSADTMTLIAVNNLKTGVQFRAEWQASDANHYIKSNLKTEVDAIANTFSGGEKEGIVPRTLQSGTFNTEDPEETDCIAGTAVENALLWPLSTKEVSFLNYNLRRLNDNWAIDYWWLRSPGLDDDDAAYVYGDGDVDRYGYNVDLRRGVRPALYFNLESVIFTSAAAGGKSDNVGLLSEVGTNDSSEWKLTLKDEAHESFTVKEMTQTAGTKIFKIKYGEAAADEKTEYISAVIKSKDNRIKYYGKITKAVAGDMNECEINIGGIAMEGGDTLCVFNEQCNGTNKTDYASELTEVYTEPIPPTITTQPNNLELTYGDTTGDTLEVAAEAEEGCTLSYQWYRKDSETAEPVLLKNETGATYTVPTDQNVDTTKYYYCEVTATRTGDGAEATTTSNLASVTINKAELTVKPKNQMFTYNGQLQGPGDAAYVDPADIARYVVVEGLNFKDTLTSVTIDGQGKEVGETPLEITGIMIKADEGKGDAVTDNYDIQNKKGVLKIHKAEITITADDKSSKAGEALKALTYTVSGDYVEGDDLGITMSTDAKKDKAGNYDIKVDWNNNKNYDATLVNGKYTVTAAPTPVPPAPKPGGTPLARATVKNKSMTIGWNKINGAEGYDIFFATCNHSHKKIACKNVKTIKGNKTFKWTKSGLKKGTAYKFYVRAYVTKNGKKTYVSKSPMFHAYTGNGTKNYTNAKSVTVNKTKVTLKNGKTYKIKAKVNKINKKKKLMPKSHAPTLRYMTSDKKIATVSSKGKIKAKGKGACSIYVYAHNGVSKSIKVTVK